MISVILPVYHVENYIEKCLQSLISQTFSDIEIICVNDCTQDNSITIVKEYQKKDPRIRLINHLENRGLGGARNTGISAAEGEYIVFIDSDDYLDPTMLEKLYKALVQSECDAAVCAVMLDFERDHSLQPHTAFHYDILIPETKYDLKKDKEILTDMWPSAWNKIYKTSIIKQNNIFFKEKILYEDHTFFYEYFSNCASFVYVPEPLYFYRQQRPQSITTQSVGREKEIFTILKYIEKIFNDIYTKEQSQKLFAKIAVRLVYERRWVFHTGDKEYYNYLRNVSAYLSNWNRDFLLEEKDGFIQNTDPIFLSISEIDQLEKDNIQIKVSLKSRIKKLGKNFPLFKQISNKRDLKNKYRNDFYWYIPHILNDIQDLKQQHNIFSNDINVRFEKAEREHCILDAQIEKLLNTTENLLKIVKNAEKKGNIHLEERISNLEANVVASRNKINEIWWLSWNIKDHMNPENTDATLLRYYPTWIPTEFPEYFKGNVWKWADKFKEYYLTHLDSYKAELQDLFNGLSEDDVTYLKLLWERNVKIIPYSEYVKKEGFLIKRDFLFTKEELEKQKIILKEFSNLISSYKIPENFTYEIPVFYYEHGLKTLSDTIRSYIKQGDILDLGAFIGDSAIILSKYTDKKVYSVEMDKDNIQTMKLVLKMNHVENKVVPIMGAVGLEDTEQIYYGERAISTIQSMDNDDIYKQRSKIAVWKVDTLTSKYGIKPHFIKLDVEGAEFNSILGAKNTICKYRPILSISIYHTAIDFLKIKPLLESWNLNYKFHIENHNPFDPIYEKILICIPKEYENN